MRLRAFSSRPRSLVMVPKRRISPLEPGSAMAMVMESLWTSSPRYSVIVCMVWLFVRIHMMNQNAYLADSEGVLAALPTRATRDNMNGNHTAFFNLRAADAVSAVSHKVWAVRGWPIIGAPQIGRIMRR